MSLRRAKSVDEYVEWVRQAVFEIADLRDCLEYELEDMSRFPAFLDPLEEGIKGIYQSMQDGTYVFGREDLLFMDLAERYSEEIPFHTLLKQINETHRRGLEV
jgi:hypothetical protein